MSFIYNDMLNWKFSENSLIVLNEDLKRWDQDIELDDPKMVC